MADTVDLKSIAERRVGSNPTSPTNKRRSIIKYEKVSLSYVSYNCWECYKLVKLEYLTQDKSDFHESVKIYYNGQDYLLPFYDISTISQALLEQSMAQLFSEREGIKHISRNYMLYFCSMDCARDNRAYVNNAIDNYYGIYINPYYMLKSFFFKRKWNKKHNYTPFDCSIKIAWYPQMYANIC